MASSIQRKLSKIFFMIELTGRIRPAFLAHMPIASQVLQQHLERRHTKESTHELTTADRGTEGMSEDILIVLRDLKAPKELCRNLITKAKP